MLQHVLIDCFDICTDKGVIFGAPLTEEGIAQIYQLIEYLSKSKFNTGGSLRPSFCFFSL